VSDETRTSDRPATFREVFASREYRFLFGATQLSWLGDYLAKAAVTALVFQQTQSVMQSAAAFALSYLPWLAGGPVLAAIAERRRFRPVMVSCDIARAALMCLAALPGLPVPVILALLFGTAMANPPFQAARSAILPQILTGDRYVVGLSVQASASQAAQLGGYLAGAALAPFYPRLALLLNGLTFAVSALLIRCGIGDRRPVGDPGERKHLAAETWDGFRVVFGTGVLRAIAIVVFSSMLFTIVPEGLAAAWAAELARSDTQRGWVQGMIMVSVPAGVILGSLVIGRMVRPDLRRRLILPFVIMAPLSLVPALAEPGVWGLVLMALVCGFAMAGMMPAANGLFVQALPAGYRARAFGVMQGGMQVTQGGAVLVTGVLADRFSIPAVVGAWSLAGVVLLLLVALRWPTQHEFTRAITAARAANGEATGQGAVPSTAAQSRTKTGPVGATA
jgi:MFS family permease